MRAKTSKGRLLALHLGGVRYPLDDKGKHVSSIGRAKTSDPHPHAGIPTERVAPWRLIPVSSPETDFDIPIIGTSGDSSVDVTPIPLAGEWEMPGFDFLSPPSYALDHMGFDLSLFEADSSPFCFLNNRVEFSFCKKRPDGRAMKERFWAMTWGGQISTQLPRRLKVE
jgi:hypothetical protein